MKLTFFGAARAVTGSCHCVECGGKKILVDCGLQQGRDERDNQELDFAAGYIDAVVVTHAHIDHSGRIPLLVKQGFTGNIYCTRLTGQLLSIMLRDSAHIQESDAQWQNQKGKRAGEEPVEPLYTVHDAEEAVKRIVTCEYGTTLQIADGVKVRFVDAGHLLGSASVEMWLTEGDTTRKVVFSGDIGNRDQPIIRDPQYIRDADYVLTESTYGDRLHDMDEQPDYTADLAAIIDETLGNGGNVIIPSFAVGRTQELLYFIREMKEQGLVKSVPGFSVVVDSPLAGEATRIFSGDLHGYLDEEAIAALKGGQLVEVSRGDLVGRYTGHTAPLTNSVIESALGGVLFIDEAYSLYRGEQDSFGLEAIDTLVKGMEDHRDELVVILAGYTKEMETFLTANSGLASRFPNKIEFPDYTADELLDITNVLARGKGYRLAESCTEPLRGYYERRQAEDARTAGNGRLARNTLEKAIFHQSRRLVAEPAAELDVILPSDLELQ